MRDRPTIADVARRAGVAPSTVSLVFSGKGAVSAATRELVLDAAAAVGYAGPDPRAASLRRGRSGVVGVVFGEDLSAVFLDPVTTVMMDGLVEGVTPLGAALLLLRDEPGAPGGDGAGRTTVALESAPIDGLVLVGGASRVHDAVARVRSRGVPVVVVEGDAGDGIPQIQLDNREAQRQAAGHLLALGHREVTVVTLPFGDGRPGWRTPDEVPAVEVTRDRLAGAREVYPDAPAYAAGASLISEGVAAGRRILSAARPPTAVIAQSDLLAAGVIRAAQEQGLEVPRDLSVTGFDGIAVDGLAPFELTTLVQPAREKGRAAGAALERMLAGEKAASLTFSCTFREGNTTAFSRG